jgi:uncharacterized membrane protein YgaE (UPF0421/DUF939 family)
MSESSGELATASRVAGRAVREATRFDSRRVWWRSGAVAVVPVLATLALATGLAGPVDAFALGLSGLLAGMSWLAGEAPAVPPIPTMAMNVAFVSLTTFLGTWAGGVPQVHLVVLVGLCIVAGLASALGRRGLVVGTHGLIAYVILGAFPQPLGAALRLGALALGAGVAQVWFISQVAAPRAHSRRRAALASVYRRLAEQARAPRFKAAAATAAMDEAELTLSVPALFADPDIGLMVALAGEARRIHLELTGLAAAVSYVERRDPTAPVGAAVEPARERLANALDQIAEALSGGGSGDVGLDDTAHQLGVWEVERSPLPWPAADRHLAALIGEVNAAARQVLITSGPPGGWSVLGPRGALRSSRPRAGSLARIAAAGRADVRKLWDGARLDAPAGRHAVRLVIAVSGTEALSQAIALPRGSWAVYAAAGVLRPGFGATFRRGTERLLGTSIGVVLATLIAVAIDPGGWTAIAVAGALLYLTFALFPASFAVGVATMTAAIVFLMHPMAPDSAGLALDRGIDTLLGGAVGLLVFVVWPTWSGQALPRLLGVLVGAQGDYLSAVLRALESGQASDRSRIGELARLAWLAWVDARAALSLARSEPLTITAPNQAALMLTSLGRLVFGVHALRLAADKHGATVAHPELQTLGDALLEALATVQAAIRGRPPERDPPRLRDLYRRVPWDGPDRLPEAVRVAFDELVDAIDSLVATLGLTPSGPSRAELETRAASPQPSGRFGDLA